MSKHSSKGHNSLLALVNDDADDDDPSSINNNRGRRKESFHTVSSSVVTEQRGGSGGGGTILPTDHADRDDIKHKKAAVVGNIDPIKNSNVEQTPQQKLSQNNEFNDDESIIIDDDDDDDDDVDSRTDNILVRYQTVPTSLHDGNRNTNHGNSDHGRSAATNNRPSTPIPKIVTQTSESSSSSYSDMPLPISLVPPPLLPPRRNTSVGAEEKRVLIQQQQQSASSRRILPVSTPARRHAYSNSNFMASEGDIGSSNTIDRTNNSRRYAIASEGSTAEARLNNSRRYVPSSRNLRRTSELQEQEQQQQQYNEQSFNESLQSIVDRSYRGTAAARKHVDSLFVADAANNISRRSAFTNTDQSQSMLLSRRNRLQNGDDVREEYVDERVRWWKKRCIIYIIVALVCLGIVVGTVCYLELVRDDDPSDTPTSAEDAVEIWSDSMLLSMVPSTAPSVTSDEWITSCDEGTLFQHACVELQIDIVTDVYGNETTWELYIGDYYDDEIVGKVPVFSTEAPTTSSPTSMASTSKIPSTSLVPSSSKSPSSEPSTSKVPSSSVAPSTSKAPTSFDLLNSIGKNTSATFGEDSASAIERHSLPIYRTRQHVGSTTARQMSLVELKLVIKGGPYEFENDTTKRNHTLTVQLPMGYFKFVMYDASNDGICCKYGAGSYSLTLFKSSGDEGVGRGLEAGRVIYESNGSFMREDVIEFQVDEDDINGSWSAPPSVGPLFEPSEMPSLAPSLSPTITVNTTNVTQPSIAPSTLEMSMSMLSQSEFCMSMEFITQPSNFPSSTFDLSMSISQLSMSMKFTMPTTVPTPPPTTSRRPSSKRPSSTKPKTFKPTSSKPKTFKPASTKPKTFKPTSSKPKTFKPSSSKPKTFKPTSKLPSIKPSTVVPTTSRPTSLQPTGIPSSSNQTITLAPATNFSDPILPVIEGKAALSQFGYTSDCSADATLLVVGAIDALNEAGVKSGAVYLYSLVDFVDKETIPEPFTTLYGTMFGGEFGNAVALSRDGKRLVVGSRSENDETGAIRIYDIVGTAVTMKKEFLGSTPSGRAGWSVAISGDGNTVTMGAPKGGLLGGGFVQTYKYQGSDWVTYLPGIEALEDGDLFGISVDLSFDGTVMAIGSTKADSTLRPPVRDSGKVDTYTNDGNQWLLRESLFGESKLGAFGSAVALSQDGGILVAGETGFHGEGKDGAELKAGRCSIFQWSGSQYDLMYTIVGGYKREEMGSSVAVSDTGDIIACGGINGRFNEIPQAESGVVRMWSRLYAEEKAIWPNGKGRSSVDFASFGSSVSFSTDGKRLFVGASNWRGAYPNDFPGGIHIFTTSW